MPKVFLALGNHLFPLAKVKISLFVLFFDFLKKDFTSSFVHICVNVSACRIQKREGMGPHRVGVSGSGEPSNVGAAD